jgi:hypothetical protein
MRNRLLLLAAAVVLSACADDQHATAPNSRAARSGAAADLGPAGQAVVNPAGKPTDQVGLTTVFSVAGPVVSIGIGMGPTPVTATCPAGSQAIGGGYTVGNWAATRFLTITQMGLDGANGWKVAGWVTDPVAPALFVSVAVTCIK